jgi:PmbA protein
MNDLNLLDQCQRGLEVTLGHGATAAEIFGENKRRISVKIEKNDLQIARSERESMIGVRSLCDRRQGFACTNNLQDLEACCTDAVAIAKSSPDDENNRLPERQKITSIEGIYDETAEGVTVEDAVRQGIRMLDVAAEMDKRIIIGNAEFTVEIGERAVVNNNGVRAHERSSLFSCFALATAREGEKVSNFDFQYGAWRTTAGIDVAPVVRRACEHALGSLGAKRGESFKGTVILSPNAGLDILGALVLFQVNGMNVLRGMSRWGSKLEDSVAVDELTIVDDGTRPGGVNTAAFDREGVPHRKVSLVENGKLATLIHNTYSARGLNASSTGHASGSARTVPQIDATNFEILPGTVSKDELIADTKLGLLVTRFSGNTEPVAGDFSGVAKGAYLIKDGRIDRPVSGSLIAGNVFAALLAISGISSEREPVFNYTLPYLRIEDVSVTAE